MWENFRLLVFGLIDLSKRLNTLPHPRLDVVLSHFPVFVRQQLL